MKRKVLMGAALTVFVLIFTGCNLEPLFDGSYGENTPYLGYIPLGDNAAISADVYVSSSLEDNPQTLPNGSTYGDYAKWAGWWTSCLNDGVTQMAEEGQGPLAWCTMTADPIENLPSWIVYDFGKQVELGAVGIWPRSDATTGLGSNAPRQYAIEYYDNTVPLEKSDFGDDTGSVFTTIEYVIQPDSWPTKLGEETRHEFQVPITTRYLRLWIDEAGGNFIQLVEFAAYMTSN